MFSLNEIYQKISDCRDRQISFDDFEDWFVENSELAWCDLTFRPAYFAIEAAISQIRFQGAEVHKVFVELSKSIRTLPRIWYYV